jgi:hypothetical protein
MRELAKARWRRREHRRTRRRHVAKCDARRGAALGQVVARAFCRVTDQFVARA